MGYQMGCGLGALCRGSQMVGDVCWGAVGMLDWGAWGGGLGA